MIQNEYNPKVSQQVSISPSNGNVGYTYNIASIEGKNGSVMSLDLEYNSTESCFAKCAADITDAKDYYMEPYYEYDADDSLGAGWKFSMLKRKERDRYYMLRDGRVINIYKNSNNYNNYSISDDTITYLDGTVELLNAQGYLAYTEDKYGNRITYTYEDYINSSDEDDIRLQSVSDNMGRTISIAYYSGYVEITKPDDSKIRLNTQDIEVDGIGEDRGFDVTMSAKVIESIYNATESKYIATFGYESSYFRYIFCPAGGDIMADDYGAYMPMIYVNAPFSEHHYIDYNVTADNNNFPIIPSATTKSWYLCAEKNYTTESKTTPTETYSYEFAVNKDRIGTVVTANNKVTQTTDNSSSSTQEVYERSGSTDILKQYTKNTYSKEERDRPSSIESKVYNSNGNYITNTQSYTYDTYGNVLTSTYKVEGTVKQESVYTYYSDSYKSLKDVTLKKGSQVFNKATYTVNSYGDVVTESIYDGSNNLQKKQQYDYDSNNNVSCKTIFNGSTTNILQREYYTYSNGYLTRQYATNSSGKVIADASYTYDIDTGLMLTSTDVNGTETVQYDSLGRITKQIHDDGTYTSIGYEHIDWMVGITDETGYHYEYKYNALGKNSGTVEMNESGRYVDLQTIEYDTMGNAISVTDALSKTTTITYDAFGRQTSVKQPCTTLTSKAKFYDVFLEGNDKYSVYLTISETGRISCEYYDVYGRLCKTAYIKNYSSFSSSTLNDIYQMPSNAELVITAEYVYDDLDRVIEQYDGEGRPVYYTYDAMGNVTSVIQGDVDEDGNNPQIQISYEYDSAGNVIKTTQGTHITTYEYDYAGRLTKMTDPMGYTETYTYDTAGNVKTSKDKNGIISTNTYNSRGQLSKVTKNGKTIEYTYDGAGNLLTSKDENGTISYTYNYDGTLASKSYPDSKTITYDTYNANKKLTAITDYLGNTTTYTYNSKGLISAVKETYSGNTSAKTTSYSYYADGNLNKVTYPLSSYMTSTYTYDYAGQVSNITNKLTSSTTYSTHDYTYDNSGNITQKTDTVEGTEKTTTYIYDSLNQLIKETTGGSFNRYYYDQYGNLTSEIGWGDVYYTYDNNNRLIQVEDMWCSSDTTEGWSVIADWTEVLTYDKNGNLLSSSKDGSTGYSAGEKTYTYDTWGRLTDYSNTIGETAAYTYYSDGLRASKTIGSDTIKYYYNGDNVINETLNGSDYATNVMGVDGYISRKQDGTLGYLFKDAHGDVLAAYSSTTNKLADYSYNAWGEMQTENETSNFTNNPLRYNGQYYDYESGMTYLRARYYSSEYRRFITEDPIRDGSNWYAYAGNNPVMFVDPSGLMYVIAWSYSKADLEPYTDSQGNINWTKFTAESSFARAAVTRKQELIEMGILASDIDIQRIDDEADMKNTWEMWAGYDIIEGLDIYSHGHSGGISVAGGGGEFLSNTTKLNWGSMLRTLKVDEKITGVVTSPYAVFHGCNTANGDFAQKFANTQDVTTYAQTGYASFSQNPTFHIPINSGASNGSVYLYHFNWNNIKNTDGWGKAFYPQ